MANESPTNLNTGVPNPGSTSPVNQPIGPLPAETATGQLAQVIPVWQNFHFLLDAINNIVNTGSGTVTEIDTSLPITGGPITKQGTIGHATSGVMPGTYGDTSHVPVLAVDVYGHVDQISVVPISGGGSGVTSIASVTPIINTPNPIIGVGTITHATSGVTPGTYGDSAHVAQVTVDSFGHTTGVTAVPITATAVTSVTGVDPIVVTPTTGNVAVSILTFVASGPSHDTGAVPDPGSTAGIFRFLREDATWQSPQGGADLILYGDGSDGNLVVSSGTTTLTKDMYFQNLTINGTGQIFTNGWKIFGTGVLDLTAAPAGAINYNGTAGGNAAGAVGGAFGAAGAQNSIGGNEAGTSGVAGQIAISNGLQATAPNPPALGNGGANGATGAGGASSGHTGGAGRTKVGISASYVIHLLVTQLFRWVSATPTIITGGTGGCGGSGGGNEGGGTQSGGGGGGGASGGVVMVMFKTINRSGATAVGAISANGGNGGTGGTAGGGTTNAGGGSGGSGAGAGWVYVAYENLLGSLATNAITANGGTGGAGGSGFGTGGLGAFGAAAGDGGLVQVWDTAEGFVNRVVGTGGSTTLGAPSGAAGGPGNTTVGVAQSNL